MEEKTLCRTSGVLSNALNSIPLNWGLEFKSNILVRNYFFLKNVTSEGAVSHNVLYYQQLSIAHYQVSFFMLIIILSSYQ